MLNSYLGLGQIQIRHPRPVRADNYRFRGMVSAHRPLFWVEAGREGLSWGLSRHLAFDHYRFEDTGSGLAVPHLPFDPLHHAH